VVARGDGTGGKVMERAERKVMELLAAGELRVSEAARMLGVARTTVGRRCTAVGIDPKQARAAYVKFLVDAASEAASGGKVMTVREVERLSAQRRRSFRV